MDTDTNSTDKNRLISLAEAATISGFSRNYLNNLAKRKRLKAEKLGNMWVTTIGDLEEFIQSRHQKGVFRNDITS